KKHDKEKGLVVYELLETLKGQNPKGMSFRHAIRKGFDGAKPIWDWVLGRGGMGIVYEARRLAQPQGGAQGTQRRWTNEPSSSSRACCSTLGGGGSRSNAAHPLSNGTCD